MTIKKYDQFRFFLKDTIRQQINFFETAQRQRQNLYLACEAMGAGTCAIAAYDQNKCDELFELDGEEEFMIYLSPVGKKLL